MAEDEAVEDGDEEPKKKRGGLVIGLVLALVGGGGGFAVTSGMIPMGSGDSGGGHESTGQQTSFIPVEPMTVSIGTLAEKRFLRFRVELEVDPARQSEVERVMPRVVDVLNTYLQSLSMADIEDPSSLLTLRSQMRRRVELVVGGGVHDLLVMEYVVN